jgi:S1-C subfamily serine protease
MQRLDILLSIDGQQIDDTLSLNKLLMTKQAGQSVSVTYWSRGETKTTKVNLDEIRGD